MNHTSNGTSYQRGVAQIEPLSFQMDAKFCSLAGAVQIFAKTINSSRRRFDTKLIFNEIIISCPEAVPDAGLLGFWKTFLVTSEHLGEDVPLACVCSELFPLALTIDSFPLPSIQRICNIICHLF